MVFDNRAPEADMSTGITYSLPNASTGNTGSSTWPQWDGSSGMLAHPTPLKSWIGWLLAISAPEKVSVLDVPGVKSSMTSPAPIVKVAGCPGMKLGSPGQPTTP